jgi:hypothetical protein
MMSNGMDSMMGPMMVWMMTYGFVVSILVLRSDYEFVVARRAGRPPVARAAQHSDQSCSISEADNR